MEHKINILLVEDESILALSEKKQLEQLGYSVCAIVGSGEEDIRKVEELTPDMVLMDIHLKAIWMASRLHNRFRATLIFQSDIQQPI